MARPCERCVRELGPFALAGVLFVFIASCGETGYSVGPGGQYASGSAGRAGSSSSGGTATGIWGGAAGVSNTSNAGRADNSSGAGGTNSGGRSAADGGAATISGAAGRASGGASPSNGGATDATRGGAGGNSDANGGGTLQVGGASGGNVSALGGAAAVAGSAGIAGAPVTGPCGLVPNPTLDRAKRSMLLRDSGVAKLALVSIANPTSSWTVALAREVESGVPGRDMQLVGNCRVLLGTDVGYEEYDIRSGQKVAEITTFTGTVSAQRLRNKNTLLVGVGTSSSPYQASVGIVLAELNASAVVVNKTVYPGAFARLARITPTSTFLVANNTKAFEGDGLGIVLGTTFDANKVPNCTNANPQIWQSLRITSAFGSETVMSTGYCASLAFFQADGTVRARITGGSAAIPGGATAVNAYFFSGFQLLSNGNFLVANWAGLGGGNFTKGIPILEYTPSGALAWYWGDPAYKDTLSGIQGVIALDGLDPTKLHVEDTTGQQVPVN